MLRKEASRDEKVEESRWILHAKTIGRKSEVESLRMVNIYNSYSGH